MTSPGRISGFRSQYHEPSASSTRREPSSRSRRRRLAGLCDSTVRGSNRMIPWSQMSSRSQGVSASSVSVRTPRTARSGCRAPATHTPADGPATEERPPGIPRTRRHARRDGPRTGPHRSPLAPARGQPSRRGLPPKRVPRVGRAPWPGTGREVASGRGTHDPHAAGGETTRGIRIPRTRRVWVSGSHARPEGWAGKVAACGLYSPRRPIISPISWSASRVECRERLCGRIWAARRRGSGREARTRLPGRRGRAPRVDFHLYPLSFAEYLHLSRRTTSPGRGAGAASPATRSGL